MLRLPETKRKSTNVNRLDVPPVPPVQGFTNLREVREGSFLGADAEHLRRSHDELRLASSSHVGIFLENDVEHAIQQLVVGVIAIGASPGDGIVVGWKWRSKKEVKKWKRWGGTKGKHETASTFLTVSTIGIGEAC